MYINIKQIFFGRLGQASSLLFTGGIVGGVLGYVFQVVMGRMLSIAEYGIFSALMAMLVVFGSPLTTLTMFVSRKVSAYRATENFDELYNLFYSVNRKILILVFILLPIFYFNANLITSILSINNSDYLYLLLFIFIIALPQSVNNAYMQGLQFFKWMSFSGVLSITLKIIIAVGLVYFGYGVTGALGGVALSTLIILLLTYKVIKPVLKNNINTTKSKTGIFSKSFFPVFLANTAFVAMTQIDMVLVKYYFSGYDTGIYAVASILGKAVMYLPGGIAMALFPMVAENHSSGNSSSHLMIQSVLMTAILSTAAAIFYYFFAEHIIIILYGETYIEAAILLKYFGFAMIPMALIMVAEYYLIAMNKVLFAYLFATVLPIQLLAIHIYHQSLINIVIVIFFSGVTLVLLGYFILWRMYKK